jgi:hypothetical protein
MWGAQPPRQTVWREGRAGQAPLSFPWWAVDGAEDHSWSGQNCCGTAAAVERLPRGEGGSRPGE